MYLSLCVTALIAVPYMNWRIVPQENLDSTKPIDYNFHFVTAYVAFGIQTTFSLNRMLCLLFEHHLAQKWI